MIRFYTNDVDKRCGGDSSKTFDINIPDMTLSVSMRAPRDPNKYIFNNSMITKIMYDALELLAVSFILRKKSKTREIKTRNQAKTIVHTHWLQADFTQNLSFAEKKEKDRILHPGKKDLCIIGDQKRDTKYIWDMHSNCKNLFILSKDGKIVIRKRPRSKELPDKQNFLYFLDNNEGYYNEFCIFFRFLDAFLETKRQRTQKNWEKFFEEKYLEQRMQSVFTRTVPLINSLSENIRKMLVFELLDKYWKEIAQTKIEAQHILQKDHGKIYKMAQEKGFIEDIQPLISIENERNIINHYDPARSEVTGYRYVAEISSFFWKFIQEHVPLSSFEYHEQHPLKITNQRMNELENQYHAIRSDSMVMSYAKHKHPEISPKDTKHLLKSVEKDDIFTHESSPVENHVNMRCPAAHGQKTPSTYNISERTVQKMIKELNFDESLRKARIKFVSARS